MSSGTCTGVWLSYVKTEAIYMCHCGLGRVELVDHVCFVSPWLTVRILPVITRWHYGLAKLLLDNKLTIRSLNDRKTKMHLRYRTARCFGKFALSRWKGLCYVLSSGRSAPLSSGTFRSGDSAVLQVTCRRNCIDCLPAKKKNPTNKTISEQVAVEKQSRPNNNIGKLFNMY